MSFCTNCGAQIAEGAKFCTNCGAASTRPESGRKTVYDGNVHKCPNCGEALTAFASVCPTCGYEIRGKSAVASVQTFYSDLSKAQTTEQKDRMIRNFPIPNTKEDIIEFMILASSNIAIDPKVLKPEFQRADRQLYLVTGGFGASANSRGSAVFCTNLHTGKNTRFERMDVMGEVKPECMPDWAKEKIDAMNRSHKNKDRER